MTTRREERQIANLQDAWTKLYFFLAKQLIEDWGIEGEWTLRQAVRSYGIDRGRRLRLQHMEAGLKLNIYNLMTYYDLPSDPRFRRYRIELSPQARLTETHVCPLAALWTEMGGKNLGMIYCEEFHHAMFAAYAPRAQINLAQTLTQPGENHCRFSVLLRPANMDREERKAAFAEYDPDYDEQKVRPVRVPSAQEGFATQCIRLFYHFAATARAHLGESGEESLAKALAPYADDLAASLRAEAKAAGETLDAGFLQKNCPVYDSEGANFMRIWGQYEDKRPEKLFAQAFSAVLQKLLPV